MIGVRQFHKLAWFGIVLLAANVTPQMSFAACGYDRVDIVGEKTEVVAACQALQETLVYFRDIVFVVEPDVRISFRDRVSVEVSDGTGPPTLRQVSGFYDAQAKEIEVTSPGSKFQKARKPWGVEWGPEIAYSLLQHELIHMSVRGVLGGAHVQWARVWLEYVAYAIQFDLMNDRLRDEIIANYLNATSFETVAQVNTLIYGFDPDLFGVRAYRHAQASGGKEYMRRLLTGEVEFSTRELLWTR